MSDLWQQVKFIFQIENKGRVKISPEVIEKTFKYVQDSDEKLEGGGVLLGRFLVNSKNIIVDKVTEPMAGDIRKRNFFKRGEETHQKIINEEWEISNGRCNYLGEWHTHAEKYPTPSNIDLIEWKKKLHNDVFSSRYLYFIILGINELRVWEGDRRTLKIKRINNYV